MKARRKSHVGFERQGFPLVAPAAHGPLHRQRPWQELDRETGFLKPARGEMKGCPEARAASLPFKVCEAPLAQAGRLYPLQHLGRAPAVVAGEAVIPKRNEYSR